MSVFFSSYSSYFRDWRFLLFSIPTLFLLLFLSLSPSTNPFFHSFSTLSRFNSHTLSPEIIRNSRVAVCLVGGARRFELTGPSILENILQHYPNSDLFLHSPLDDKSFKFSLLRTAPRIASVRIFQQEHINETESALRVLAAGSAPNGIQGLLQYFNLVEGCLPLILNYQNTHNFTYDWIVRTRVDGYWTAPLDPANFVPGKYTVPLGSCYGGINDRLGIGDLNTSTIALSRLSLIPELDLAGLRQTNSESSFRAQLSNHNVSFSAKRFPFCVVTDRWFGFPPKEWGLPMASMSSRWPVSGAYCRPCAEVHRGKSAKRMAAGLKRGWSWIEPGNGTLELCNVNGPWEAGWEERFDDAAGEKLACERKRVKGLSVEECISEFEEMKRRSTGRWEVPAAEKVCGMGLLKKSP